MNNQSKNLAKYIYLGGSNILREIEDFSIKQDDSLPITKYCHSLYSTLFRDNNTGVFMNRCVPNEEENVCASLLAYPYRRRIYEPDFSIIIEDKEYIFEELFENEYAISGYVAAGFEVGFFLLVKDPIFVSNLPFAYIRDEKSFFSYLSLLELNIYGEERNKERAENLALINKEIAKLFLFKLWGSNF